MKRSVLKPKIPVFVNVNEIRRTPKAPVILYFTKAHWNAIIATKNVLKRSAVPLNQFQMRYQSAPWGNGDVIIYPNLGFHGFHCKPIMEVVQPGGPFGALRIRIGFECERQHCEIYTEAYPDHIPKGANGIGCDDTHCRGGCREIFVGTRDDGYFTCRCG